MQLEATTAELAELLGVSEKTICSWAKRGIMEKLSHGKYDLGESLRNWTAYQKMLHKGCDNPLENWWIQRDIDWSEAHPLPPYDPATVELRDINELATLQTVTVERDAAGRIVRVVGEKG
jgi:hypothetical protein